jgi:hypothetical protein
MQLSKSTFIRGYDCPIRLRHVADRRASNTERNEFLRLLAEGGFQFEFLVRHAFPGEEIHGDIRDPEVSHAATVEAIRKLHSAGGGVLHQATLWYGGCVARMDMVRISPDAIDLCEIKAKSFVCPDGISAADPVIDGDAVIMGKQGVRTKWLRYVADVAFQSWVAEQALAASGIRAVVVRPRLVVVNKKAICGDHDAFGNIVVDAARCVDAQRVTSADMRWVKEPPARFRSPLILEIDVSNAVRSLRTGPAMSRAATWGHKGIDGMALDAVAILAGTLTVDSTTERGLKCRDCEFRASDASRPLSGFDVCWGDSARQAQELLSLSRPSGYNPGIGTAAGGRPAKAKRLSPPDWVTLTIDRMPAESVRIGMLPLDAGAGVHSDTRNLQIAAEHSGMTQVSSAFRHEVSATLALDGRASRMHFLDFETTMSCLPLAPGMRPYEEVAFQFSCHTGTFDGKQPLLSDVCHAEYLDERRNASGSVHDDDRLFVDALREAVGEDSTPIFHWANHERKILARIRTRLAEAGAAADPGAERGDASRLTFLDGLIGADGRGGRLVDMLKVASGNVMTPGQGGRYSMKSLLPAICRDPKIRQLVGTLMGGELAIGPATADPYKLLPPIPGAPGDAAEDEGAGEDPDHEEVDGIRCGTDAMRAFQQLRFESVARWKDFDRAALIAVLKRYCKLDTSAMVAVWTWMVRLAGVSEDPASCAVPGLPPNGMSGHVGETTYRPNG